MTPRTCIVICRGDREPDWPEDKKAPYQLSTRTVFESERAALLYCNSILHREPLIIPLDPKTLRVGEERGTWRYWRGMLFRGRSL